MPKEYRKYLDTDVYTEAKKRIRHIIETFDTILVSFSGGKDSLTALMLTQEVYDEMGIKEKLKVFFRDEEVIEDQVIQFVTDIYKSGKFDFRYYAIPLRSNKFVLGKSEEYIQWDRNRKWVRQPPDFAITIPDDQYRVFSQYDSDEFICGKEKGKVAIINGIRADESMVRFRSCINKKNENYICATKSPKIKFCKPIYDWSQRDIFVYFCKNDIKYCEIYDNEVWNGSELRVSTPLHAESAKRFSKIRTLDPVLYEQIIDIFPDMLLQERYWKDFDRDQIIYMYDHTFDGIRKYIDDNIDDIKQAKLARERVDACESMRKKVLKTGDKNHNLGGYPVLYVFKAIISGNFKRVIQPTGSNASKTMFEYEGVEKT